MNRICSLALLAVGIALIVAGFSASNSLGSDFSRFLTGAPTEKAIWLIIGGTAAAAIGMVLTLRNSKRA